MTAPCPLISIIVPLFNAGKYLAHCLDSILAQSYANWQLILVNDGSADDSGKICDRYAGQDVRIQVIHQTNTGVSGARNQGIEQAKGDYLCFVDADDHILPDYLSALVRELPADSGRGLIIHGMLQTDQEGNISHTLRFGEQSFTGNDKYKAFTETEIFRFGSPFSKLYNLSLIRQQNIRFNPLIRHGEDLLFMTSYILSADYIRLGNAVNYVYETHGSNSLSRSNRPYLSERTCYEEMKKNLHHIKQESGFTQEKFAPFEAYISLFLIRALPALYRPPYTLPASTRIKELRSLQPEDFTLLKRWYHPRRLAEKAGRFFLLHHFLYGYEKYMSLLFTLRYRVLG